MIEERKEKEKVANALLKVALGYQIAEVTEEYAEVDGELKLTKRKKTKKDVPPDLKAVQMLLLNRDCEYAHLSDEELEEEKERLLALLQEQNKEKTIGRGALKEGKTKKVVKKSSKKKEKSIDGKRNTGTKGKGRTGAKNCP